MKKIIDNIKFFFHYHFWYNFPLRSALKFSKYFRMPKWKVYCGKWAMGFPIYLLRFNKILDIYCGDVQWKDKYDTPRFIGGPYINIVLFRKWQLFIYGCCPDNDKKFEDQYWEMALWTFNYCNGDIKKAKKTWPWGHLTKYKDNMKIDMGSTWRSEFLNSKALQELGWSDSVFSIYCLNK